MSAIEGHGERAGRGTSAGAVQARIAAEHARRAHGARRRRAQDRRRELRADRRPLHGRVARADARDRACRARRRRDAAARRRIQAAHLALRLPGSRPGGPEAARRGEGRDGPADRHRADGHARCRGRARGRRRRADRRAQHAELPAAGRGRPLRAPGAAQARAVRDARRAADGGRVHPQGGQSERDPVRARDPHVRDRLPLHARPDGRAGAEGADRTCR